MPKIKYLSLKFKPATWDVIRIADSILTEYKQAGLVPLTLRQLYYQFVARDAFPDDRKWSWTGRKWVKSPKGTKNAQPNYKWLSGILNDARLAGLVDWDYLQDNTRNLRGNNHWDSPQSVITAAYQGYMRDRWEGQKFRVEAWIEKDALAGILERACSDLDVPFFACKGYTSASELWTAGLRLKSYAAGGQLPVVIHLGDHDPSGMDMTRDVEDRLRIFMEQYKDTLTLERVALNMNQIEELNPPPSPAKVTDSRYKKYSEEFGDDSWELDALDPKMLVELVRGKIKEYLNQRKMNAVIEEEAVELELLKQTSYRWEEVVKFLSKPKRKRKKKDGK